MRFAFIFTRTFHPTSCIPESSGTGSVFDFTLAPSRPQEKRCARIPSRGIATGSRDSTGANRSRQVDSTLALTGSGHCRQMKKILFPH
ncbi:hypothetical protein FGIG_08316 [Fasciola gigantica]|uniref:Uncharacterized protein n=1 Tax=Fasciola gigantica TaxID=46835 RepID=A0A504Z3I9_FASGI|nr:hypothetical protein FGIG_08316 [Fasciola gigantica]